MIKPDARTMQQLNQVAEHYPDVVAWFKEWYMRELVSLPKAGTNTAVMQGRCQVLEEINTALTHTCRSVQP